MAFVYRRKMVRYWWMCWTDADGEEQRASSKTEDEAEAKDSGSRSQGRAREDVARRAKTRPNGKLTAKRRAALAPVLAGSASAYAKPLRGRAAGSPNPSRQTSLPPTPTVPALAQRWFRFAGARGGPGHACATACPRRDRDREPR